MSIDGLPDDLVLADLKPRMRCVKCGRKGETRPSGKTPTNFRLHKMTVDVDAIGRRQATSVLGDITQERALPWLLNLATCGCHERQQTSVS
jgi:hypothetical protein